MFDRIANDMLTVPFVQTKYLSQNSASSNM